MSETADTGLTKEVEGLSIFEKYLTLWVGLCIGAGMVLGKTAPGVTTFLDGLAITVAGAPVVSIPIITSSSANPKHIKENSVYPCHRI